MCFVVESFIVASGIKCHVALTGGCLYGSGERKDCDILFYRVRQVDEINRDLLESKLKEIGLVVEKRFGWMSKATFHGKKVDIFYPETDSKIRPGGTDYGPK